MKEFYIAAIYTYAIKAEDAGQVAEILARMTDLEKKNATRVMEVATVWENETHEAKPNSFA